MRKTYSSLLFLALSAALSAQTNYVSVANGDWFNPSTWSPTGVPGPNSGNITVNTQVTFNQLLVIGGGQGVCTINPGASVTNISGQDTITFGNDAIINHGYIYCGMWGGENNDSTVNYGTISVAGDFAQSGLTINRAGGSICAGQMIIGQDLVNNGSIQSGTLVNGGQVTASGGRFCISGNFINTGTMNGSYDICDATPNTPWDVNAGTISGTVTYCAVGPCSSCQPNGIDDHALPAPRVSLSPNPAGAFTVIAIEGDAAGTASRILLYDYSGRLLRTENSSGNSFTLDLDELPKGLYLLRVEREGRPAAAAKLLVE